MRKAMRDIALKTRALQAIHKAQVDAITRDVLVAERAMANVKLIYESRLDEVERFKNRKTAKKLK